MDRLSQSNSAQSEPFAELPFTEFCPRYLKVQNKAGEIVPLKLNNAQQELHANLTGRDIVLKARQVGISTSIQALHFHEQMKGNTRTSTLCHEDELTATLRRMSDRFYTELPDTLQERNPRKYANAKLTTYAELNSESSIATVGGQAGSKKGRGGSVTRIHGSEVAFWPDAESVMAAAMQAGNPAIVLESTPNGMVGYFYDLCMDALENPDSIWTLHFFPWWYDDEYRIELLPGETLTYTDDEWALVEAHGLTPEQIKWRRRKQQELPHTFKQEYPEDPYSCFLASGQSFFGDVEHIFTAPFDVEPNETRQYVGGLDFAQTSDYLSLSIFDAETLEQVDQLRINGLEWQEMRRRVSEMANYWNAEILGEGNSMGTTNIELLQKGEILDDDTRIAPVKLSVFNTTPSSKPPLIQGLYHAIHEAGMRFQDRPFQRHELRAFISKQTASGHWQYEASAGATDDFVITAALAWRKMNAAAPNVTTKLKRFA